jgi:dipicolinate synthase subunit A
VAHDLTGLRIALLGGDRRELVLADALAARGAEVRAVGLPWPDPATWAANRLEDTVAWAEVVVAPVGGTDEVGVITYSIVKAGESAGPRLTEDVVRQMRPGALVVIGHARPFLHDLCTRYGVRLREYRNRDEFALLNAVPSAEGAIALAMRETDITLHAGRCLVLGYGRVGQVLAADLRGLGAHTVVVARSGADRARAFAAGHRVTDFGQLRRELAQADVVFNTVPAPVLTDALLARLGREAVIIDLASAPGGTDFGAAKRLGLRAVLAPGLPGLVAPRTAGRILSATVLAILEEEWP